MTWPPFNVDVNGAAIDGKVAIGMDALTIRIFSPDIDGTAIDGNTAAHFKAVDVAVITTEYHFSAVLCLSIDGEHGRVATVDGIIGDIHLCVIAENDSYVAIEINLVVNIDIAFNEVRALIK